MRVDDLEGRLRGLILKNNSSPTGNSVPESHKSATSDLVASHTRAEQRPISEDTAQIRIPLTNTESAVPVAKGRQDGQFSSPSKQQEEVPQGRGRRPNQAQRRQMGKLDLQNPPSASTNDARQPAIPILSSQSIISQSRQTQESQQTSNSSAPLQTVKARHRLPIRDQQRQANQQRQVQNHPTVQMPQHLSTQHPSHARGFVPNGGPQFGPSARHASMPPQSMMFVDTSSTTRP